MKIDNEGYVLISDILQKKQFRNYKLEDIINVVSNNNKKRFDIKDNIYIRARQGHNKDVGKLLNDDLMLPEIKIPLDKCIHGTTKKAYDEIKKSGLKSMNRKHIHMAMNLQKIREQSKVAIYIDMKRAMEDGIKFYKSDNDVILCKTTIQPKYFMKIEYL